MFASCQRALCKHFLITRHLGAHCSPVFNIRSNSAFSTNCMYSHIEFPHTPTIGAVGRWRMTPVQVSRKRDAIEILLLQPPQNSAIPAAAQCHLSKTCVQHTRCKRAAWREFENIALSDVSIPSLCVLTALRQVSAPKLLKMSFLTSGELTPPPPHLSGTRVQRSKQNFSSGCALAPNIYIGYWLTQQPDHLANKANLKKKGPYLVACSTSTEY